MEIGSVTGHSANSNVLSYKLQDMNYDTLIILL